MLAAFAALLLVIQGAATLRQSQWHGPSALIWKACPEISGFKGNASTTVGECQSAATAANANAINYNNAPGAVGSRCQLRKCAKPVAPAWAVEYWRGYATFPVPPPPPPRTDGLKRVLLTEAAQHHGAVCLDGSAPAYYWRPGSGSGAKSWVLFLEGGGWCSGVD
eukprot:COSAG05_NODE_8136_length_733_cov_1.082019_1_plen_164_part_01